MSEYFLNVGKRVSRFQIPRSLGIGIKEVLKSKKRNITVAIILVLCMRLFFYSFFDQEVHAENITAKETVPLEVVDPMNKINKGIINPEKDDSREKKYCQKETEKKITSAYDADQEKRENKLREMIGGYPISEMIPYISRRDEKTAAFLVAIARKESSWGVHAPSKNGRDCYNYWGYKGSYNLVMGYSCFDSPEQAVSVVGDKIEELIKRKIDTPEKLVVWKCGSSCAGHDPAGVRSWIGSVREYFQKMLS